MGTPSGLCIESDDVKEEEDDKGRSIRINCSTQRMSVSLGGWKWRKSGVYKGFNLWVLFCPTLGRPSNFT